MSVALDTAGAAARAHPEHPLRIALVTESYYPHVGGVCEHVHFLAREARRRGHHVDIVTSNLPGAAPARHVIRVGHGQGIFINGSLARVTVGVGLRRQMRALLAAGRYDVVHVQAPLTPTLPLLAIDESPVPVVGTFHAAFDRSLWYTLGRRYFQRRLDRLDVAIAVSEVAARSHARYFDTRWEVIPNGVDLELFQPGAARPAAMHGDVPTVLFLGRLDPRNGLPILIDAYRALRRRGRTLQLVVVGDGPLASYYRQLAQGEPGIVFTGSVASAERAGYYANADVYAAPTLGGASFGITLLEAMACGTAIVASRIPGFRCVVEHEREALLVPRNAPHALADAIDRVLGDDALRRRLGDTGRERAHAYGWRRVADQVLGVYARLTGRATLAA